ncbi:MAG: hypothetical protein PHC51_09855 [bacterium]|nr:hypothetical protein [bacterium]
MKLELRLSKSGFLFSGFFLGSAVAVFGWLMYSAATNPADSGEGGVLLLFFAWPWIMYVPKLYIGPFSAVAMIVMNSLLIYLVAGGLRFSFSGKR